MVWSRIRGVGAHALAVSALTVGLVALAGCGQKSVRQKSASDPHPIPAGAGKREIAGEHGGRMVFVTIGDPKSFNSVIANEVSSTDITNGPLFTGLTRFANGPQVVEPGLASSWEVSEDRLTYTFHLRPGLRWSDGEPLDADDVIFTARVSLDPKINSATASILQSAGKPWRFEKVDSLTVRVVLPAPFGPVPDVIGSMYILPEHKLGQAYAAGTFSQAWGVNTPPKDIVTNGPFLLEQYVPAEKVVLARNPHYWEVDQNGRRLPYLDRFVFVIVKDLNTMALRFQGGEIDLIDPIESENLAIIEDEQKQGKYTVYDLGTDVATEFMWFNLNKGRDASGRPYVPASKREIFEDVRFRRAVSHAVNRDGMVRSVLQGRGSPGYTPITPANRRWYSETAPKFPYDPKKAMALLDEMGLVDKNGDGVREDKQGRPVEFTLYTNSENNRRKGLGTIITENLKDVGVRVNFQPIEFNTMITHIREDHRYEACLLGLTGGVPPDPALSANVWRSSGPTHQWWPKQARPATPWEAEIDRLMDQVVAESDYEKRKATFDRLQHIVGEQQPMIYLVQRNLYVGVRNRIEGVSPSVLRPHALWNVQELWVRGGEPRIARN